MTKRLIVVPVAVAALAFPATALADGGSQGSSKSPAQQCRAERAKDPQAFKDKYGTNKNKSNAFGKCVSQKARAKHAQEQARPQNQSGDDNDADDNGKAEGSRAQGSDDQGESHSGGCSHS